MSPIPAATPDHISVLVADSNQIQCQLLTRALRRRPEFRVISCGMDPDEIEQTITASFVHIALMTPDQFQGDMAIVRRLHLEHPEVVKVLLLQSYDRDLVVNAFRSGARGLFCFTEAPFRALCRCIHQVCQGQIWANAEQLQFLLDMVTQVPSLRVVNAQGDQLLTPREEQVVALVAEGLSNRDVAAELQLSEHTIKKYLFRIFDKLGISTRVELVLYAVNHGSARSAQWLAGVS